MYFPLLIFGKISKTWIPNHRLIGLIGRMFANGPGDLGSISGHVIPKILKMVLDTSVVNTQQYKVCIKGKVEQSRERSSAPPLHLGVVAIEKGTFWLPSTIVANNLQRKKKIFCHLGECHRLIKSLLVVGSNFS